MDCHTSAKADPSLSLSFRTQLWFYRELSRTGVKDNLLRTFRDIFESASNAVLLAVLLFAALGWSLTRESLSTRELRLILVLFSVYSIVAFVKALCDSARNDEICKAYLLTEYVLKSVVMLGVIVALNVTISQLRQALTEARWNHFVTPLTYMKLNQFQLSGMIRNDCEPYRLSGCIADLVDCVCPVMLLL